MLKKVVVLMNVGTPDAPTPKDVKKYLSQFLGDKYIMPLPYIFRKLLVNCIIVPFRKKKSADRYQKIWTNQGSPLLFYTNSLAQKLQLRLGDSVKVLVAMRYGNPSFKSILPQLQSPDIDEISIVPLFPQYSESTTKTAIEEAERCLKTLKHKPNINFVKQFYNHPAYINAMVQKLSKYKLVDYDQIIFSFHGLPIKQIEQAHREHKEANCICEKEMPLYGKLCYKACCYETARLLAAEIPLHQHDYKVTFQSRFANNWLAPATDDEVVQLAKRGYRKIMIVAPSFVTDCLETLEELNIATRKLFVENGGEELTIVECLNDEPFWAEALEFII